MFMRRMFLKVESFFFLSIREISLPLGVSLKLTFKVFLDVRMNRVFIARCQIEMGAQPVTEQSYFKFIIFTQRVFDR